MVILISEDITNMCKYDFVIDKTMIKQINIWFYKYPILNIYPT